MSDSTYLCELADLKEGEWKLFQRNDTPLAVILLAGKVYAIDDRCPHRAGPMHEGSRKGTHLTCPWHAKSFDLATGKPTTPNWSTPLKAYAVTVDNGRVMVAATAPLR